MLLKSLLIITNRVLNRHQFTNSTLLNTRHFCKNTTMTKKALVFLAPGAEEMEFVISVDVLRRGGIDVTIAGLPDKSPVKCSREVVISPDIGIADVSIECPYDVMVLPGGLGGAKTLSTSQAVCKLLKEQENCGRVIAAICAAPIALKAHGIGIGKNITSYPSVEATLSEDGSYVYKNEKVVVDDNIITSQGPATAYDFALSIVEKLNGRDKACEVAKALLMPYY